MYFISLGGGRLTMDKQAYQLRESDESKLYAMLEILDMKSPLLAHRTKGDYEPGNQFLNYSCPLCQKSDEDNPCIDCYSLFCHY